MTAHQVAHLAAAGLVGFIAGVAVAAVVLWFLRDKIRAAMIRRRRNDGAE